MKVSVRLARVDVNGYFNGRYYGVNHYVACTGSHMRLYQVIVNGDVVTCLRAPNRADAVAQATNMFDAHNNVRAW